MNIIPSVVQFPTLIISRRFLHISSRNLLKVEASVDGKDEDAKTALHKAVQERKKAIVTKLLKTGVNVNLADDMGNTALHFSRYEPRLTKLLLKSGANVDIVNKAGKTTLHRASTAGQEEVVKILLKNGADVNLPDYFGNLALHRTYSLKIAQLLLKYGSNVNAVNSGGKTALHNAAKYCEIIVPILLKNGANVNQCDRVGLTALHRATTEETARLLLDHGADPNARTHAGNTPLHFAAQNMLVDVVNVLLEYGADVNSHDVKGYTILDAASRYKEAEDIEEEDDDTEAGDTNRLELTEAKCKLVHNTIKSHIIKLKVAGLYVSERNLQAISFSMTRPMDKSERFFNPPIYQHELYKYEVQCKDEIARLRNHMLDERISVHDVLLTNKPFYVFVEPVAAGLESLDYKQYPIYEFLIRNKFKMDKIKAENSCVGRSLKIRAMS